MTTLRLIAPIVVSLASLSACDRPTDQAVPPSTTPVRAASSVANPSSGECLSLEILSLADCRRIASLIAQCPSWDAHGKMDDDDWQSIIDLAYALQQIDPPSVERALTVYGAQLPAYRSHARFGPETAPDPWTNPVLLIRVMIDTPEDAMRREQRTSLLDAGIALGSLFGAMQPSGQRSDFEQSAGFPVAWRDGRPTLAAGRSIGVILGGGSPHEFYDPAREFRVFRAWYGCRRLDHLAPSVGSGRDAWRDLYEGMMRRTTSGGSAHPR